MTTVVLDGQSHTFTGPVTCVSEPNGGLVILAVDGRQKTVRALLRRGRRLVAEKVGIRTGDASGFTADSDDLWVSKVDDLYTISGRMPANPGETWRRDFTVEVRCQNERTAYTPPNVP